jgi:hypothetical protein
MENNFKTFTLNTKKERKRENRVQPSKLARKLSGSPLILNTSSLPSYIDIFNAVSDFNSQSLTNFTSFIKAYLKATRDERKREKVAK